MTTTSAAQTEFKSWPLSQAPAELRTPISRSTPRSASHERLAELPKKGDAQMRLDEYLGPISQGTRRREAFIAFGTFVETYSYGHLRRSNINWIADALAVFEDG